MVVSSGDFLLTAKVSWKPLRSLPFVTCTLVSASMTERGGGTGTAGPISTVRCTPLSIGHPRDAFRQGDAQPPSDRLGQLVGAHGAIGVADAPELLGVVEIARRDVVDALALGDRMFLQQREAFRRRHEAPAQINESDARRVLERRGLETGVAAGRREWVRVHGIPAMPR